MGDMHPQLDAATALLSELIALPTISSDSNMAMIALLSERLESLGAKVEVMLDEDGGKANLWATVGPDIAGGVLLSGHTDVVPVSEQDWTSDPFVMEAREGRLYGRGACDMKGFIACAIVMAPALAVAAEAAGKPLRFCFTHDEEVGCLGARALVEQLRGREALPAMAIIGEPTMMKVIEGNKGCCEYTTHFHGMAGHGSAPAQGVNAVEYAGRYLMRLLELRSALEARAPENGRFDPAHSTINPGRISGGVAHNVIPSHAELEWEMRPVVAADLAFVQEDLAALRESMLKEMRAVFPGADISTETIGEVVGLEPEEHNAARDLVAMLTGENAAHVVPFNTEAGLFQQIGMQAVLCGPGSIDQAHKPDEYVELEQMSRCLDMLGKLAQHL
ncbi:MAG: acetylornithine deacetylase [Halocynthiibacter sp.]|jgi:acetylornithine deacetylase